MGYPMHRRAGDDSVVYRFAESPWAKVGHMVATIGLAASFVVFFATGYSTVKQNDTRSRNNAEAVASVETRVGNLRERVALQGARLQSTEDMVQRVEKQSAEDREAIIERLQRLQGSVNDISTYLRDNPASGADE